MAAIEGWLQMPAERNLIGRAGTWKSRYVRFGTHSPTTPILARSAISPIRPTTATGVVGSGGGAGGAGGAGGVGAGNSGKLSHALSGSVSDGIESPQLPMYLTIYKQKSDAEPVARYPLASIASCYIGDVASRHNKKKSVILPTLIVNLRAEIQLSSSKSFRRRSHDVPPREGAKKESIGREILYFRPAPDNVVAIERWAKEIQSYLVPSSSDSNTANTVESAFREKFNEIDLDTPTASSSLFFVDGEPSTALLSPSLRSRASNLSSIESDDKGSLMSSTASELPSPRADEDLSRSSGVDGRPSLHVATKLRHSIGVGSAHDINGENFVNTTVALPVRRETILDRFFSSTAPSSPDLSSNPAPMNSIARFEALISDIEFGRDLELQDHASVFMNHPKRIPSPTQRALEYVSTGLLKHSSGSSDSINVRSSLAYQEEFQPHNESMNLSVGNLNRGLSRQTSEASLGTIASMANSTGGGGGIETNLGVSNNKRHSLADFSMMRLSTTPPLFQISTSRRGSYSDIPRISESYDDGPSPLASTPGRDFSNHPRVNRPLFREFSF